MDEIEAFRHATRVAKARGWPWRQRFWWYLDKDGTWRVESSPECIVVIDDQTGEAQDYEAGLDPAEALVLAREHAADEGLTWKQAFTLAWHPTYWEVGSCQSQLGGQTYIHVGHDGKVIESFVNPK